MNIHEYQAKQLFREYGMPVPKGSIANTASEAVDAAKALGTERYVVKAQVHAGGRGKAGGVKLLSTLDEVKQYAQKLLGTRLVTYQTTEEGQPVNQLLVEEPCNIDRELYLGVVLDRSRQRVVIMASTEGGVDIEEIANKHPEKILQVAI